MTAVSRDEYDAWIRVRNEWLAAKSSAYLATSQVETPGYDYGVVSDELVNQAADVDKKKELRTDTAFGDIPYDVYLDYLPQGRQGAPVTAETEDAIYRAAVYGDYLCSETIPAQTQLALMQASRKAHNNWRQRRQQLLTHRQLLAANRVEFANDLEKMASGGNLLTLNKA